MFNYTHQPQWNWIPWTYIQVQSWCAYSRPAEEHLGKTRVRKSTLKTWNNDLFCNSAMELIPRGVQQIGAARCSKRENSRLKKWQKVTKLGQELIDGLLVGIAKITFAPKWLRWTWACVQPSSPLRKSGWGRGRMYTDYSDFGTSEN